ncbi:radical SAM protein [Holophaga foetida]|uniref:radical SAM protein n=1 Tax=Holophaga foetida TaxID=35839 RepID=UPI0002473B1B|nr:radical SAM protein [Holophaga foetida]
MTPVAPPAFLFVDINRECNLRCRTCMYWAAPKEASYAITIEHRRQILEDYADLSPRGTVVICGGETLLAKEAYFDVTASCRRLGLRCLSVTNGSPIRDLAMAERLLLDGPHEITVSLNHFKPEIHDGTRGVLGSWDWAVQALKLLLQARKNLELSNRIYVMAIICEQNYRDLEAFYPFVLRELGADKLKLNFLQPTFGPLGSEFQDAFFAQNTIADPENLGRILRDCDGKFGLGLNPRWVEDVLMYHRSIQKNRNAIQGWRISRGTDRPICNSYDRNIMVDLQGNARLCFSNQFRSVPMDGPGALRRFWESSEDIRTKMRSCAAYCGISHSVRRENGTLKLANA